MFGLNITNENKVYIVVGVLVIIGIIVFANTMYVKSCVKSELDHIKKAKKKKMKLLEMKKQQEQMVLAKLQQSQMQQQVQQQIPHIQSPPNQIQEHEMDADSYFDPTGREDMSNMQFQEVQN